jgi:hypothetical protein
VTGACESTNVFSRESVDRVRARLERQMLESDEIIAKLIAELNVVAAKKVRLRKEYQSVDIKAAEMAASLATGIETEDQERSAQGLEPLGIEELPLNIIDGMWDEMIDASVLLLEGSFGGNLL